ncbi:MAG: hypothetical protein OXR73_21095, partial [Myxococcales bacterium]|nr:hypothetical protein [Myxococcales bacterium]
CLWESQKVRVARILVVVFLAASCEDSAGSGQAEVIGDLGLGRRGDEVGPDIDAAPSSDGGSREGRDVASGRSGGEDAAPSSDGGSVAGRDVAPGSSGGAGAGPSSEDARVSAAGSVPAFWEPLRICGTASEYYSTALETAAASDAVVLARVVSVELGRSMGAGFGYYAEFNLTFEATEFLGKMPEQELVVSFVADEPNADAAEKAIDSMDDATPTTPVLLMLRLRSDLPIYRLVTPFSLLLDSNHAGVRAPIDKCHGLPVDFLAGASELAQLVPALREAL